MSHPLRLAVAVGSLLAWPLPAVAATEETVATAVYARIGNGYRREQLKGGAFKPEYYALANGGRIAGTTSDKTVDRVTYPQVADVATKLPAGHRSIERPQEHFLVGEPGLL